MLQPESEETITKTLKTALEIGLGQACSWLTDNKAMSALKRVFTREVGESSWEDAEKNHPNRSKVLMEYKGKKYSGISNISLLNLDACKTILYMVNMRNIFQSCKVKEDQMASHSLTRLSVFMINEETKNKRPMVR